MTSPLSEGVSLEMFREFLLARGYRFSMLSRGHERWLHSTGRRPVVLRMYCDPVPLFVLNVALRTMEAGEQELTDFLS
ncbi:hypothetical protein ACWKWU_10375 [Chitinophaga lutea]